MDKANSEIRVHKLGIDPVVRKDHEECLGGYVFVMVLSAISASFKNTTLKIIQDCMSFAWDPPQ
jgi:hypothetical protein